MTEDVLETSPFGDDLDAALTAQPSRDGPSRVTLALAGGVLLVAGLLAGIQAQKMWGTASASSAQATGFPAGFNRGAFGQRAAQGQTQQGGGFGGAGGGVTAGTVKLVDGKKIYVETAGGSVVTVTTTGDTKVSVTKAGKLSDLKAGSTVIVRGEQGEDGTVAATTVTSGLGQ